MSDLITLQRGLPFRDLFKTAELGFHILLRKLGSKGIEAKGHNWVGNRKLKLIEQQCSTLVGLAFPAIAPLEKAAKLPHDYPWSPLCYGTHESRLPQGQLDDEAAFPS